MAAAHAGPVYVYRLLVDAYKTARLHKRMCCIFPNFTKIVGFERLLELSWPMSECLRNSPLAADENRSS
jgi:hypothetical protein